MQELNKYPYIAQRYRMNELFSLACSGNFCTASKRRNSVKSLLCKFAQEKGLIEYVSNRIREQVATIIVRSFVSGIDINISTLVNDLFYHTDAIMQIDDHNIAVDFTSGKKDHHQKLRYAPEGRISVENPYFQEESLPFSVIYMNPNHTESILYRLEGRLYAQPDMQEKDVIGCVQDLIRQMNPKEAKELFPSIYMKESSLSEEVLGRFREGYRDWFGK